MTPGDPTPGDPASGAPIPGNHVPGDPVPQYPVSGDLAQRAEAWITDDPSLEDRAELQDLLDAAQRDDPAGRAAAAGLADRFAGRLEFGTAGLRGVMGAGPNRMNRAVVRAATAGLARWLHEHRPAAARAGVVVGWDARHRSAGFAAEAAAVLTGAGIRVHLLPGRSPTPLLAFAVRHLSAGAGVMITASHNPPADNGYKLYLGDGAQIIPPVDAQIEAAIRHVGPLRAIPLGPPDSPLITRHGDEIAQAYLDAILAESPRCAHPLAAWRTCEWSIRPCTGWPVRSCCGPSSGPATPPRSWCPRRPSRTPTSRRCPSPTPRSPGPSTSPSRTPGTWLPIWCWPATRTVTGSRSRSRIPEAEGGWRTLTGDQVGALLGAFVLDASAGQGDPQARLAASTVVSSSLLSKIAAAAGVQYAETLTGFKWIVRAADERPRTHFVFGYEEALGYAVGDVVRDKDGISAALAMLGLTAQARSAGQSVLDRWDALETAHGVHLTAQLTLPTRAPGEIMAGLRAGPPAALGEFPVRAMTDLAPGGALPPTDALILRLDGARVVLRPSGTEPKLKAYLEVTEPVAPGDLAEARRRAESRMTPLRNAVEALLAPAPS